MGIRYLMLKKEFLFLKKKYGFIINFKQKFGAYCFIVWKNSNTNILVLYDEQSDYPVSIRIYDANSFSFDAVEYKSEFAQGSGTPREKICRAAEWLGSAIEKGSIAI